MSTLTIIRQRRNRRSHERHSASQRTGRAVFGLGWILSLALVVLTLALALTYASLTRGLPPVEELTVLLDPQTGTLLQPTTLYDRTGEHLLAALSPDGSANPRTYIPYNQFPQDLIDATVAAIQPDFWTSSGYGLEGWRDADTHPTLAQTLVYDLLLWDASAAPLRAIQERMLAAQVTARYGRQQVLEWYLNSADYGHYAYGAQAAAQFYFGKSVTDLTLAEATLLAATAQAPALNPLDAPQSAEERRIAVIKTMLEHGWITPEETSQAILNPPSPVDGRQFGGKGIAPAFVTLTLSQLDAALGAGRVARGGMVITTSLDYDLQLQALCAAQTYLNRLAGNTDEVLAADGSACEAASLLPAVQSGVTLTGATASVLVLDPTSGQVLAAVGDIKDGVQSASLSVHPAGTSVTPFLYLTGFSRGLNPASLGWDLPSDTPDLGQVYHGPVRLRTALVNDYLPPADTVLEQMGADSVQSIAVPFGLDLPAALLTDDFDISPLTLAQAYGIFADNGTLVGQAVSDANLKSTTILRVTGVDHSLWLDWTQPRQQAIVSPQLAYLMNHVLSDETARWPSLGYPNALEIGRPAGAKLSRTLDLSAGWTVGYTPQRVTVVYLGAQADNTSVPALSANLWNAVTRYAVRDLPSDGWDMPSGLVTVAVCDPSGLLPTADCPSVVSEVFLEGRQPVQTDTLYRSFQVNVETGLLATVFSPPELVEERVYMVLPAGARAWAEAAGIAVPPSDYDIFQEPAARTEVQIAAPAMFSDGRGQVNILGTAAGADFVSYRLEYGQGLDPQAWVLIGEDVTTPVTGGLLATWDTTGLDGLYALRLMVVRSDQRVDEALVQVTLDNTPPQVAISYPAPAAALTRSDEPQVALQAQVNDPFLTGVAFYLDGDLLDTLETSPFGVVWEAAPGDHTLRVVATDRAGNTAEASIEFSVK